MNIQLLSFFVVVIYAWPVSTGQLTGTIAVDSGTGNVLVASSSQFSSQFVVTLYDSTGSQLWTKSISASSSNILTQIQILKGDQGVFVVTGVIRSSSTIDGYSTTNTGVYIATFNQTTGNRVTFGTSYFSSAFTNQLLSTYQTLSGPVYATFTRSYSGSSQYYCFRIYKDGSVDSMPLYTGVGSASVTAGSMITNSAGQVWLLLYQTSPTAGTYSMEAFFGNHTYSSTQVRLTSQIGTSAYYRFFQTANGISYLTTSSNGAWQLQQITNQLSMGNLVTITSPLGGSTLVSEYDGDTDFLFVAGKNDTGFSGKVVLVDQSAAQVLQGLALTFSPTSVSADVQRYRCYHFISGQLDFATYQPPATIASSTMPLSLVQSSPSVVVSSGAKFSTTLSSTLRSSAVSASTVSKVSTTQKTTPGGVTVTFQGFSIVSSTTLVVIQQTVQPASAEYQSAYVPPFLTFIEQTQTYVLTENPLITSNTLGSINSGNSVQLNLILFIELGAGLIGLLSVVCCCILIMMKPKYKKRATRANQNRRQSEQKTSYEPASYTVNIPETTTSMGFNTSMITAVTPQKSLSIPGYRVMTKDIDYSCDDEINEGGFATVFYGRLLTTDAINKAGGLTYCAVKMLKPTPDASQAILDEDEAAFIQEVSMLNFFGDCDNFVKLIGFSQGPNAIVMKFYDYGNVEDILKGESKVSFDYEMIYHVLLDVTGALTLMHYNGFLHCDIKPANVLLDKKDDKYIGVVSDLGLAQVVGTQALTVAAFKVSTLMGASFHYASPELLKFYKNPKVKMPSSSVENILKQDVYSVAIMAYEMITRKTAWTVKGGDIQLVDAVLAGERPVLPEAGERKQKLIMEQLVQAWNAEPEKRPHMKDFDIILRAIIDPLVQEGSFRMVRYD